MIEHIAALSRACATGPIFVGDPDDIVRRAVRPRPAADPGLDRGSTTTSPATSPASTRARCADREALRAELGYGPDERVCVVTVGGSGVGGHLLRRVVDAYPRRPRARCPGCAWSWSPARGSTRRDPAPRDGPRGPRVRAATCYRHLAACDLAVVQGGLTTLHGAHRRRRAVPLRPAATPLRAELPCRAPAGAVRRRAAAGLRDPHPGLLAEAIAAEIGREVSYRPVATDGAARGRGHAGRAAAEPSSGGSLTAQHGQSRDPTSNVGLQAIQYGVEGRRPAVLRRDPRRVDRDPVGPLLDVGLGAERRGFRMPRTFIRRPVGQGVAERRRRHSRFFSASSSRVASTYPASAAPKHGNPARIGCRVIASGAQIGTQRRHLQPVGRAVHDQGVVGDGDRPVARGRSGRGSPCRCGPGVRRSRCCAAARAPTCRGSAPWPWSA